MERWKDHIGQIRRSFINYYHIIRGLQKKVHHRGRREKGGEGKKRKGVVIAPPLIKIYAIEVEPSNH